MVPIFIKTMKWFSLYVPPGTSLCVWVVTQDIEILLSPAGLACKKVRAIRFWKIGFLWETRIWFYPFLLDYVAAGVSTSWPQYPVAMPVVYTGGKALKGWWWIQRLVDSSGTMTQAGTREILGLEQNRILLFDFPSLMETQWKENAAGYPQWHSSGMKPYDIPTSQSQLQSGQLNNVERRVPQSVKFTWQVDKSGQRHVALCHSNLFIS